MYVLISTHTTAKLVEPGQIDNNYASEFHPHNSRLLGPRCFCRRVCSQPGTPSRWGFSSYRPTKYCTQHSIIQHSRYSFTPAGIIADSQDIDLSFNAATDAIQCCFGAGRCPHALSNGGLNSRRPGLRTPSSGIIGRWSA